MTSTTERFIAREDSRRLMLLAALALAAAGLLLLARFGVDEPAAQWDVPLAAELPDVGPLPEFGAIHDVNEMKEAFFDYLLPAIDAKNQWLEDTRALLIAMRQRFDDGVPLGDVARLEALADRYRVTLSEKPALEEVDALIERVDIVPPSLALAQAAAESGWGRSRFAREANNLFGEWCFEAGCGLVPQRRLEGAGHEVRRFESVSDAVGSYYRNLNSHPAYAELRSLRVEAREAHDHVLGVHLIDGLEFYSERGGAYLDELRLMIRVNDLTRLDLRVALETAQVDTEP